MLLLDPRGGRLRCEVAETRRERLQGLLGRRALEPGRALLLPRASSVHTVGMRFPILVARLDDDLRVLDVRRVGPGRLLGRVRAARHVLECPVGTDLRPDDRLISAPG
jgi:uncharacterized membrane protein (UPF0127 family)